MKKMEHHRAIRYMTRTLVEIGNDHGLHFAADTHVTGGRADGVTICMHRRPQGEGVQDKPLATFVLHESLLTRSENALPAEPREAVLFYKSLVGLLQRNAPHVLAYARFAAEQLPA